MLYQAYEIGAGLARITRACGGIVSDTLDPWVESGSRRPSIVMPWAVGGMLGRAGFTHDRPEYGIDMVTVGGRSVPVVEEIVDSAPFGNLVRFWKDVDVVQPRVLVVAPLSGHFATLLRNTIRTLLQDHDVYVTDWFNARDVPLAEGRFGFDDYVDHVVRFLEVMGPGAHVVAVCQPTVQALAAAALMAETGNPAVPASLTLMAGPIDVSVNPTKVNTLATDKPIEWFEKNLISTVPRPYAGAGRRVYPGFLQLSAFMSMNAKRHVAGHSDLFWSLVEGDRDKAIQISTFYDEYFAILDLSAEFYLETVKRVFQDNELGRNQLTYRGRRLDMASIRKTALMTVEGERDDICSVGQTVAAQDLCTGIKPYMKRHHLQAGVGHYGVFSGKKWETQVYPLVRNFIEVSDLRAASKA